MESAGRSRTGAAVELDGLWKRYEGGHEAVRGVSLRVEAGEFVVLVGPSGCGKSTTLRMIAGLEDISSGTLSIGGRRVNEVAPRDRDIAMVFQSYALYPHMTVRENMAFGLTLRKVPKAEIQRRVDEAAKMLGLAEGGILERKPKALSGGQRQRVAMGRAIVRQPSVFLFDEPLSNLDAKLRVQMRLEIAALHRRVGATMVYVTHDQVEAMTLADRIAVMSVGELQQFASPMELYLRPKNRFVAGFIGSPAMNFVDGEVTESRFVAPGIELALTESQRAAIAGQRAVTLGLRPQQLGLAAESGAIGQGRIAHLELMGAETFAHVAIGEATLVVSLPGDAVVRVGDAIALSAEVPKLHVFNREGLNLTAGVAHA
jgi:multiple sugar transport system ATP-binding protein